jgi:hypothetical protein
MKSSVILLVLGAFILSACNKKDDGGSGNNPPGDFALLTVANLSANVDRKPMFTWEAATDPDGDTVVYDLYVQKLSQSDELIAADISGNSYQMTDLLSLIEEYSWFVVAKDGKGGQRASATFTFSTRNLSMGQLANPAAGFPPRQFHTTFAAADKLILLGGYNGAIPSVYNDIWSTNDGSLWGNETTNAVFDSGYLYSVAKLENDFFLLGGRDLLTGFFDKVWTSSNGVEWSQILVNAPFGKRYSPTAIHNNKIWLAGGINQNGDVLNDTWVSSNGADWTAATLNAAFPAREAHHFISFKNKLWITGGVATNLGTLLDDIWSSSDGINWELEASPADFGPRYDHKVVQYDGKLWLFGGLNFTGGLHDIWYSEDGINWFIAVQESPALVNRFSYDISVFNDRIWLTAGRNNSSVLNQVWVFE